MKTIQLGKDGPTVSRVGLGCMGMSGMYGPADRAESLATIHEALEAGVTLLDTGDFYGMGHNEMLIGEALKGGKRDKAFISVKFGAQRSPDGQWIGYDARPEAVKTALAYTLQRLGVDHIDLYRPARLDPNVPIEDTVGAVADCIKAGWVRHLGLSEISAATLRRAHAVHPVRDVQFEYSVMSRDLERELLPAARELGVSITAYGILSRGLISGSKPGGGQVGDFRGFMPRFSGDNLAANQKLIDAFAQVAASKGASVVQLAVAWVLARGEDIVPLIGARKRSQLQETLGALALDLTAEDLAAIEAAIPPGAVQGDRYPAPQMAHLEA
ncbi:aryl-alcohol dehydrogenase-like predicted oxidoreductase [Caulobacter ginsengisoli]|uniref:Aryl-alcohol dehydrogenase-like predicted oxidoreductase n=1 Tax=Caulobacter ginsengisoli TaxID=400775 RepID=A0ABU0INS1_9CAUL|nr:aldo/keto reductase [Caulobacter ginsengisoli]MDQ0463644.1 aryl-alcohol dehydrogenase-like predicted oxidoreductase [Caulobacter ginsengisoli]